jgi:tetratricopeptide (TPR) repeat protein
VHPAKHLFRFHHVLVRDVAYRGIPKAERSELHELAARGLDRRDGADELVGYHFEHAYKYLVELARPDEHALELAQSAGERLGKAGIRAWKRADTPAALNLLSRAVDLLPEANGLMCELGAALRAHGEVDRAKEILTKATAAREERIELRARIELAYLDSIVEPDRAGELLEVATAALPVLETQRDDRALGRAWLCIGHVRGGFYCQYEAWEEAAARAAEYYRRAGWSPSTSLGDLGCALFYGPRDVASAVARCEELLREHEGDWASESNLLVWLGGLEAMRGRFDDARLLISRAQHLHDQLGLTPDSYFHLRGIVDLIAGDPELAEEALRASCEVLRERGQTAVLATRAAELANAICERGRYNDAETWAQLARESAGSDDLDAAYSWRYAQAKILLRRGALDEGHELARDALDLVARTDALNRHADCLVVLAEILIRKGRDAEAAETLRSAQRLYDQKGNTVSAERVREMLPYIAVQ